MRALLLSLAALAACAHASRPAPSAGARRAAPPVSLERVRPPALPALAPFTLRPGAAYPLRAPRRLDVALVHATLDEEFEVSSVAVLGALGMSFALRPRGSASLFAPPWQPVEGTPARDFEAPSERLARACALPAGVRWSTPAYQSNPEPSAQRVGAHPEEPLLSYALTATLRDSRPGRTRWEVRCSVDLALDLAPTAELRERLLAEPRAQITETLRAAPGHVEPPACGAGQLDCGMLRAYFRATGPARTTTRTRAPTAAEVAASLQGLYRCDARTVEFRLAARYEWLPSAQGPPRYLTEQAEGTLTLSRQEPFPRLDALTGERLDARWSQDACEREPLQ